VKLNVSDKQWRSNNITNNSGNFPCVSLKIRLKSNLEDTWNSHGLWLHWR